MITEVLLAAAEGGGETQNFLLPNGTILVELVLFVIVFFVFARWIVPPLSTAMRERDEMVKKQAQDSQSAARRFEEAEERFQAELAEARAEAGRIRDQARADANKVREEMREKADREVDRIREQGAAQLAEQREQTVRQLRSEIGGLSTQLAERITGQTLADDGTRRSTVDRFLADLDGGAASGGDGKQSTGTGGGVH